MEILKICCLVFDGKAEENLPRKFHKKKEDKAWIRYRFRHALVIKIA
jgi:hypothetical protein